MRHFDRLNDRISISPIPIPRWGEKSGAQFGVSPVVGHAFSFVKGFREVAIGGSGLLGSGAVTLGTAGAATPITAGTGATSAGLVIHGTTLLHQR